MPEIIPSCHKSSRPAFRHRPSALPSRSLECRSAGYCAIFLDDNNRKPIVRLYFNTKQKYLGVFDENKNCERMPIDTLNGIYAYSEQIREEVRRLL